MRNLYRISYFARSGAYFSYYVVAENENQIIMNYPESLKIDLKIIQTNLDILKDL